MRLSSRSLLVEGIEPRKSEKEGESRSPEHLPLFLYVVAYRISRNVVFRDNGGNYVAANALVDLFPQRLRPETLVGN